MGSEGYNVILSKKDNTWRKYENFEALKKYVNSNSSPSTPTTSARTYDQDHIYEINTHMTQTTTGTQTEVETTDSIAIAQLGKTELTLIAVGDTNDNYYDAATVTIYYLDQDGTAQGPCVATLNSTDTTTEVAFVPAVADFYDWDYSQTSPVLLSKAVQAGENIFVGVTGASGTLSTNTMATIEENDTTPDADNMVGVGSVYVRSHTNHNDADAAKVYVSYFTPWGKFIKNALGTIDSTDGTTEILIYKTTAVTYMDGTVLAATYNAGDIYYIVDLWTDTTPTANSHEFLLCDEACANVDGSGGDVYGVIKETEYISTFTRLRVPKGYDGWAADIEFQSPAVTANGDDVEFIMYYYPDGETVRRVYSHNFRSEYHESNPFKLEEEQDMYVTIADIGNPMECSYEATYIIAKRNTIT